MPPVAKKSCKHNWQLMRLSRVSCGGLSFSVVSSGPNYHLTAQNGVDRNQRCALGVTVIAKEVYL